MGQKKGLGGLSPEKKKLLKQLIMDRAMAELKREEEERRAAKAKYIEQRVGHLNVDGKSHSAVESIANDLYDRICQAEEEKYDLEVKVRKQDYEINELTIAVNDIRGTFPKPMLKKVMKIDTNLGKLAEYRKKKELEKQEGGHAHEHSSPTPKPAATHNEVAEEEPEEEEEEEHKEEEEEEEEEE